MDGGFVPVGNLIGRAVAVVYSLSACKRTEAQKAGGIVCLESRIGQRP